MHKYELYINQNLPSKTKSDLDRIKAIIDYSKTKKLYYRIDKFFTEFLFDDYKFSRDNMLEINRIFDKVVSNIRIAKNKDGKLIIVIEKFPSIFIDRI